MKLCLALRGLLLHFRRRRIWRDLILKLTYIELAYTDHHYAYHDKNYA